MLRALNWSAVLGRAPSQLQYLASLIADVSDALGVESVPGLGQRTQAPLTTRHAHRPQALLRNL